MSFHEDIPMNKKDESRINKKFHAERVKTRAGGKETPNFLSKMGSESADAIRKARMFKQGMKTPTMKAISEKGKARQSVSDNFHKSMKKYGYDGGKKAEALEKAKK